MSKRVKDTDYLYLSSYLHAKEAKMLSRDKLERMLTEPNFEDAARVAFECGYADMSGMDSKQIGEALAHHREKEFSEVAGLIPDKRILEVFGLKYKYHNAKAIVKAGGLSPSIEYMLAETGAVSAAEIQRVYEGDEYANVPKEFAEAITEAKNILARTDNPQLADFVLDKAYYAELAEMARSCGVDFIERYVRVLIDSANLRTSLRVLLMGKREELLSKALIPGGTIAADEIMKALTKEDVIHLFATTPFAEATLAPTMTAFEKGTDNAVNAYLAGENRAGFGPGTVVTYLSALETEIMTLRIVLSGRRIGIDPNQLRERLRESYV